VGDEISFTFNQLINCDKLNPVDDVLLFDAATGQPIDIDITCYQNKIVLDPNFQNKFFENRILRAELHGIEDMVGNVFNGTKFNNGVWEFYVDRNELAWLTDSMGMTKYEDETKTAVANIHNRGGYPVPFSILNVPGWVHVVPNQGTLAPNEIRPIQFTADPALAFGHWTDSIVLRTETGQNPFFMGGDEGLPVGIRVVCRPPYRAVNGSLYENTMSMVLRPDIEGVFSADLEDIVAAFIDNELRGLAKVQHVPQLGVHLAYLTVYGNPNDLLKPLRLEVWDASACQRYGMVQESFTFQADNVIGTPNVPQVIHTDGLLLREVPFNYGWNWLSFNLAFPNDSVGPALASLKHPQNDLIKSQSTFSLYSSGWFGTLNQLNNKGMYIYRADVSDTLRMVGTAIDPATTPIPLTSGWNWIGYIPNYSLPIDLALSSVNSQPGDLIKSQHAFAQYAAVVVNFDTTYAWLGNLKYLQPPNGYQIKLAQAGSLTYPPPPNPFGENPVLARDGENAPPEAYWTVDPSQFEYTSTLIGMLQVAGGNGTENGMELGAFVNGELRGAAQAIYVEPLNAYLFFLTTYANTSGELLRYKLYDAATGQVSDLLETLNFTPNEHRGTVETPVPFHLQTSGVPDKQTTPIALLVQPNPFHNKTNLSFTLPSAQEVVLTITDPQGREVLRRQLDGRAGMNTVSWDGRSDSGAWLGSGVYVARLQAEAGSVSKQIVLQRLP
ncbi:MAG: T9SS type A sorting domain-containing protein, partial [Saprospiraceae bacterium]|nr:T9SS type A sorting domain-containing protein [Saprospiraceae bacterium]